MDVKENDVIVVDRWVIVWPDVSGSSRERVYKGPIWMVSRDSAFVPDGALEADLCCDVLFTRNRSVKRLIAMEGDDKWTSGLKGTVLRLTSPSEWPDEVCVAMAKRALTQ